MPQSSAYLLAPGQPTPGLPIFLRPSIAHFHKCVNINTLPISYAFQPRLRGRLTPGRLPLPGKPWVYGERVFHPFYRYSCQHNHFSTVHRALRLRLQPVKNAPLPDRLRGIRSFRPVSYYAFFKRWLLLSQRPGCLYNVTTLTTEHEFGDLSCRSGLLPFRRRTLAPAV